ncbi:uncharacterized protein N7496_001478 [Penicillium cataractarum]|uniref:Uncharacterized protein n=1 Tax=Penicillium cataractarum TaxID=2100454 RepID=A0A9X0B6Z3_9EURO|nr:uncharacterized protein N7496_001478 [Penicillium cataractarum]KAJ5390410.1 hypothetical protein N7496_001478 [Penicillium cataractarum]
MQPPADYTQSQPTTPPPPPNPSRTTIYVCVPLDNRTIDAFKASPNKDLAILIRATHELLVPNNRDLEMVIGDGPLVKDNFVPVAVNLKPKDGTDPAGEFDLYDEDEREWLIKQAEINVAGWMFRYREFGRISFGMKIFLQEIGFI